MHYSNLPHEAIDLATYGTMVGRLVLAAACGALIGWLASRRSGQREAHDKAAGLRTHMLLALGGCLFTLITLRVGSGDPLRVVQGMLIGTGFIAGGVIFRQGDLVRGLTTAVGLWVMGAIGTAVGVGEYFLALLGTLIAFLVMSLLQKVERRLVKHPEPPAGGGKQA